MSRFEGGCFVDWIFRVALVPRVEDNPPGYFISMNIICGFIHRALAPMISMSRGLAQWLNITIYPRAFNSIRIDDIKRKGQSHDWLVSLISPIVLINILFIII